MTRYKLLFAALLAAGAVATAAGLRDRAPASQPVNPATANAVPAAQPGCQPPAGKAPTAEAGIKAITAEYAKAFNAGDAKAAAALWTEDGEYVGDDDEVLKGRAAIEKDLAAFLKANPKATAEVEVVSVRLIARGTATAEGVVRLRTPGEDDVVETRYTALHVREDGKWQAASVR